MDLDAHKEMLKKAFAAQAKTYPRAIQVRAPESVVPMIDLAMPRESDRVLDVATGAGFVALGFAPFVKSVTGIDLTPEMLAVARGIASERGCANADFRVGDVEDLKFPVGAFEIVTCRFTFHHFGDPEKALFEMKRVLTPDGRIVLYDVVSSADDRKAEAHNAIEKARDPSHVRMLQPKEFLALFKKAGLEARAKLVILMKRDFDAWMEIVDADEKTRKKVRAMLEEGGDRAGLGVRVRGGRLTFTHTNLAWRLSP